MSLWREFNKGIFDENPTFRLVLGMCPTLAVTTVAINGLGMGLATAFVLVCSNVVISCLRNVIPSKIRIPMFIVVIASFVTVVDLLMAAYFYQLHKVLGLFIPLIVVNCIIMARAEAFASRNGVFASLIDGLGMGVGFTISLIILGSVREILSNGTIFGISLFGSTYQPVLMMLLPPGAFIVLGLLMFGINKLTAKKSIVKQ